MDLFIVVVNLVGQVVGRVGVSWSGNQWCHALQTLLRIGNFLDDDDFSC